MKNTENADRPMSAMVYWPSTCRPLRWSGNPAQTSFSSAIRDSRAVTQPSSQRSHRAARRNRHDNRPEQRNSAHCCICDSPGIGRPTRRCDSVAFRTAAGDMGSLTHVQTRGQLAIGMHLPG